MCALLAEKARTDEQLADATEGVYTFRVQERISHGACTLLLTELRRPISAHLYISDNDIEAQICMQFCVVSGWDREICGKNSSCPKSSEIIRRNVPARW